MCAESGWGGIICGKLYKRMSFSAIPPRSCSCFRPNDLFLQMMSPDGVSQPQRLIYHCIGSKKRQQIHDFQKSTSVNFSKVPECCDPYPRSSWALLSFFKDCGRCRYFFPFQMSPSGYRLSSGSQNSYNNILIKSAETPTKLSKLI